MSSESPVRVLTGITTTGTPHLGNYVGAIRPTVQASRRPGTQSFLFLADYHALIKCDEPARIQRSTLEIAASWLAAGLDPEQVTFYRQSDIPEIPELTWLLTCVTGKGVLNRAHAYKAALDKNAEAGQDPDFDVTAGLFMYPVLMGADILMFKAHQVPVGRDQIQHIEMARDMAASFNHLYGEHLVLPEAVIDDNVALLPGLDGRKMSKSYDNVIALFGPREQLRKQIMAIVTDSRLPGEPKRTEGSALYQIYRAFAADDESAAFARAFADGIAWGDAKQHLFDRIEREIGPMRARYEHLIAHPQEVEAALQAGAAKARAVATPLMRELRRAVGLRALTAPASAAGAVAQHKGSAPPTFKQYRGDDGAFYFKLASANGQVLLQSQAFGAPREAGQAIKRLQTEGTAALPSLLPRLEPIADESAVRDALQRLAADANAQLIPLSIGAGHRRGARLPIKCPALGRQTPRENQEVFPVAIYVIDDHPLMREAIVMLLRRIRPGANIVELAQLSDLEPAVAQRGAPEFFCLDLKLPDTLGISGVRILKANYPEVPLAVISATPSVDVGEWCREAGADIYIEKSSGATEMGAALRALMLADSSFDMDPDDLKADTKLSKRQKQLIVMLDEGMSNREIADRLGISEHTVKVHLWRLFRRLGVKSRTQAIHFARTNGLLGA